jgi:hypothetical protein
VDDGANSEACSRSNRLTAISTKPLHTQLTPSSATEHVENGGTQRHHTTAQDPSSAPLDPLENKIGQLRTSRATDRHIRVSPASDIVVLPWTLTYIRATIVPAGVGINPPIASWIKPSSTSRVR